MFDIKEKLEEIIVPIVIKEGIDYLFGEEKQIQARFSLSGGEHYPQIYNYKPHRYHGWAIVKYSQNPLCTPALNQMLLAVQNEICKLSYINKLAFHQTNKCYRNYLSSSPNSQGEVVVYEVAIVVLSYGEYLVLG